MPRIGGVNATGNRVMPTDKRDLINSILVIGTFVMLGLVLIDQLIGDPTAFS